MPGSLQLLLFARVQITKPLLISFYGEKSNVCILPKLNLRMLSSRNNVNSPLFPEINVQSPGSAVGQERGKRTDGIRGGQLGVRDNRS